MLEDYRDEFGDAVLASSALVFLFSAGFFVPEDLFYDFFPSLYFSGFFANTASFVTMKVLGASMPNILIGVITLGVSLMTLSRRKEAEALQALFYLSMSVFGVLSILYLILDPMPLQRAQVIGIGAQIIFFGVLAVTLKDRVLKTESYGIEYRRPLYLVSSVLFFTGFASLGLSLSIFEAFSVVSPAFSILALLYSGLSVYASIEVLKKTANGFWTAFIALTLLFAYSVFDFGFIIGGIVAVSLQLIVWNRKELFGEIRQPVEEIREKVDY